MLKQDKKVKIVVLGEDMKTLKKDKNFEQFFSLGDVVFCKNEDNQLMGPLFDADIALVNKFEFDKSAFEMAKNLKYIGVFATGYNNIDLSTAKQKGVTVCNVPSYSTSSVAQLTMTFVLNLASSMIEYNSSVKRGDWINSKTFCYYPYPFSEIEGKTLGIYGFGAIGQAVAKRAMAFGMKVVVCTRTQKIFEGVEFVDKTTLFKESDFITFHCPLTEDTKKLVNKDTLGLMKKSAFIINTSRGGVVDEQALSDALNEKRIAGAAVDVISKEPMESENPLYKAINCIITPHIAWTSFEARDRLTKVAFQNLVGYLKGEPQNEVGV